MIFVTEPEARQAVNFDMILDAIRVAFIALDEGRSRVFETTRGEGADSSHFFAIKSGFDGVRGLLGLKSGSYKPSNTAIGLPSHTSTTMLIDAETAAVKALVEATFLNGIRTACADVLATKKLMRADSQCLLVVGNGAQALSELVALTRIHDFAKILVAGRSRERAERFCVDAQQIAGRDVEVENLDKAVRSADVIVTATPSNSPLFDADWVRPGTHISAMGADNAGKQELPIELMQRARIVVDYTPQAILIGEMQHLYKKHRLKFEELPVSTLGGLLRGRQIGRERDDEVTVFDSSGIALQDIAAAATIADVLHPGALPLAPSKKTE